jgi:hypothetical protein
MLYTFAVFALALAYDIVPTLGLSEFMTVTLIQVITQISKYIHEINK